MSTERVFHLTAADAIRDAMDLIDGDYPSRTELEAAMACLAEALELLGERP